MPYDWSKVGIVIPVSAATSTVDAQLDDMGKKTAKVKQDIESTRSKLMTVWSYSNQLISMILRGVSMAVKGTSAAAGVQAGISYVQKMQAEFGVLMAAKQAALAIASGNIPMSIMLSALVLGMQSNLVLAWINQDQAQRSKQAADQLQQQIDSYRSG